MNEMNMQNEKMILLNIAPSSGIPIYKQIIDQVKRMIASGTLQPGDDLPSVRNVASRFQVNPMTISKAYSLLEATGFLERQRGKGMIVSNEHGGKEEIDERIKILEPAINELLTQAKQLAIPKDKLKIIFEKYIEEKL
jgi:GntR family transcriptional regulator